MIELAADLSLRDVLADHRVRAVFQPIRSLDTDDVVAYEALARGPEGTPWESPAAMFAAAQAEGLVAELDWACRAAAVREALERGLPREIRLFLNTEPISLMTDIPDQYRALFRTATNELSIVVEVTERQLAARPADLIAALAEARSLGMGIAIDDVGAEPASLAFLPFVQPDVIKLDMSLVQEPMNPKSAAVAAAVSADAERRGAVVLAEGIENAEHLERANVLGAALGQGWLLGRPQQLDDYPQPHTRRVPSDITPRLQLAARQPEPFVTTPWELVAESPRRRVATKALLIPMSAHIEQSALSVAGSIVIGTFQHRRHFTARTSVRYSELAAQCGFVAALATGLTPLTGDARVRLADIEDDHPLSHEWNVIVVGPHYAAALFARELPTQRSTEQGPGEETFPAYHAEVDADRRFDYVVTHDRDLVTRAARCLFQYIVPARPPVAAERGLTSPY